MSYLHALCMGRLAPCIEPCQLWERKVGMLSGSFLQATIACANTSSHPVTINEECIALIIIFECKAGCYLSIGCVCCWIYVNLSNPCILAWAWSRNAGFCALSLLSRSTLWLWKLHGNLMTAGLPASWCQSKPSSGTSLITFLSLVKRKT